MVEEHNSFDEDVSYLEEWVSRIQKSVLELKAIADDRNVTTFFSIGSTTQSDSQRPYLTPLRLLENGVISGVIVFSQSQAIIAANAVKDIVDSILVDAEKKIGIQVGASGALLEHFNIRDFDSIKRSRSNIEFGNISAAIRTIVSSEKLTEYKPNDLTVDAVWTFLSLKLNNLSGKKIAVLGCGNIGFKLALKLVESGVNVVLVRRDTSKGMFMANAINMVKPETTIATASYTASALQASAFCDVLIGAANTNTAVITWDMIQSMSPDGFIIDIGKGNVDAYALKMALENDIDIIRGDVTASLYGFISHKQQMQNIIQHKIGRREVDSGVSIVSGGILGKDGEVVVDNFSAPSLVYGVSDGCGNMKTELNENDKKNIRTVKEHMK